MYILSFKACLDVFRYKRVKTLNSTATNTTNTNILQHPHHHNSKRKTGWIVKKQEEKLPRKKTKLKETLAHLQKQNKNTKEKGVNSRFRAGNVIQSGWGRQISEDTTAG